MKYRVLGSVAAAAVIAFAQPVSYLAQEAGKAGEILAAARKAIGGGKLESLKSFSVQSDVQRNVGGMQLNADVEIVLELPDKYARVETLNAGPGMSISGGSTTGFNGEHLLQKIGAGGMSGGTMIIRMGGGGGPAPSAGEKPTPEQLEQLKTTALRSSKTEASRLMLGWFAMAHPAAHAEYTYLGEAESVEGKAYVLDVKNADGFAARLFIDEQNHLPLMVTYKAAKPRMITQSVGAPPAAGGHAVTQMNGDAMKQVQTAMQQPPEMADYTVFFEEWRDADGVKFPFKMRRASEGSTTEEWTVSKVRLNPKIDPKKFVVESGS
jgi:hypothetical protein